MTRVVSAGVALLLVASSAFAQGGVISARVIDLHDTASIASAELALNGTSLRARADSAGRVRLVDVPPGTYEVSARRLGYKPATARVAVVAGDTVELVLAMQQSSALLAGMKITETAAQLHLHEFEARSRSHIGGYFITDSVIRRHEPDGLQVLLHARIPGIRVVVGYGGSINVYSTRGSTSLEDAEPCGVAVFLDGVRMGDGNAGVASLFDLAGIEYYPPSFAPAQYRIPPPVTAAGRKQVGGAACGVLLFWTRP